MFALCPSITTASQFLNSTPYEESPEDESEQSENERELQLDNKLTSQRNPIAFISENRCFHNGRFRDTSCKSYVQSTRPLPFAQIHLPLIC